MAYTTLTDVKTYLGIGMDIDDALLTTLISTAQRLVEAWCGRVFEASADSTRAFHCVYPYVIGNTLYVDNDLCQITTVTNGDGSIIAPENYIVWPSAPPYHAIHLKDSSYAWTFNDNPWDAIAITGRWGYSLAVPELVAQATTMLTSWLYRNITATATGNGKGKTAQHHNGHLPGHVVVLLEAYRRV